MKRIIFVFALVLLLAVPVFAGKKQAEPVTPVGDSTVDSAPDCDAGSLPSGIGDRPLCLTPDFGDDVWVIEE